MTFDEGRINRGDDGKFGPKHHQAANIDLGSDDLASNAEADRRSYGDVGDGSCSYCGVYGCSPNCPGPAERGTCASCGGITQDGRCVMLCADRDNIMPTPSAQEAALHDTRTQIGELARQYGSDFSDAEIERLSRYVASRLVPDDEPSTPPTLVTEHGLTLDDIREAEYDDYEEETALFLDRSAISQWDRNETDFDEEADKHSTLAVSATGSFVQINKWGADRATERILESVPLFEDNRTVRFRIGHNNDRPTDPSNQFISVDLNISEQEVVADRLTREHLTHPREVRKIVRDWSNGEPDAMADRLGVAEAARQWERVTAAVRTEYPESAAKTLTAATQLRQSLDVGHHARMQQVGSDLWKQQQIDAMSGDTPNSGRP